ncbi:hypothetical protein [Streptomyces sp. NPDC001903]|uniref:hypothetical protein n=1 Tax=Streptomyces sp. NPDC001903 TaxID=3364622 RepID=UPI00368F0F50
MPRSSQNTPVPEEGGHVRRLWPLLAVFAVAVPAALLVVEKFGAHHFGFTFLLILVAGLAGYAVAVEKIVQEKFAESRRRTRMLVWLAAAVLYLGSVAVFLEFRPPPPPLARMKGHRDVAVAGFAAADGKQDQQKLDDFAADFALALKGQLPSSTAVSSYAAEARLPLKELRSSDDSELERKTAAFADETDAEIVLAGLAEPSGGQTHLWPAVYIRSDQVTNLPELEGWYVGESPIIVTGWDSSGEREQVRKELAHEVGALAEFLDAMDAWRKGDPAKAGHTLDDLLDPNRQGGKNGFVPSDLALLFHGAAAEQRAIAEAEPSRTKLLETARKDYEHIIKDRPASRPGTRAAARARAALSLQENAYRRAIDPSQLCRPDTVKAAELAQVSQSLKALADNPDLTDLGRLKAVVDRAQVEDCRFSAGLVTDDGAVNEAVKKLSEARNITGAAELRAFAESIAATHAYRSGDRPAAIKHIQAAIDHGTDTFQRALWHGLLARWSLELCDLPTARKAHQEALAQFDAAKRRHRGDPNRRTEYEKKHAEELKSAEERCVHDERGSGE